MNNDPNVFKRLQAVLNALNMPTMHIPANAENPIEMLLISVDEAPVTEGSESQFVFQLYFAGDMLDQALQEAGATDPDDSNSVNLQFVMVLPVEDTPHDLLALHQLLSICNRILPVGFLGLNEENRVYLRYGLLAESKSGITLPQVVEIIDMLSFFVLRMSPSIGALIQEKLTLQDAISAIETSLLESAQLSS